jgi:hypothetical protein
MIRRFASGIAQKHVRKE